MAGSGDLSETGKKAMRLTLSQIAGFGGSGRWRVVRRRDWRGLAAGGAVWLALELAGEERQWRLGFGVLGNWKRGGGGMEAGSRVVAS
jgi:hypothetical protein